MEKGFRVVAGCSVALIDALLVAGVVSHGFIRHLLQAFPLWIVMAVAIRHSVLVKGAALLCFVFWLLLMMLVRL